MRESRGSLYLLTGFILGLIGGLVYSFLIQPVRYTDISPELLEGTARDQYRALIAVAYAANQDLVRARARLALLNDADPYRALAEQAQRWLAAGQSMEEARALGLLAASLAQAQATLLAPPSPAVPPVTTAPTEPEGSAETPAANSPTALPPDNSPPPISPATATPTPAQVFVLSKKESVCDPMVGEGLIQVYVWDAGGAEAPGVEIIITWEGGEDHFFTGLKPEMGRGYADFSMTPGVNYTVRLASGGEAVPNLTAPACKTTSGQSYWGVWVLEFSQP
ncbi:MAG: hypothetical protein ACOY16_02265 [Chloroflexota bacterium]